MTTDLAQRNDPEECPHLWELLLNMVGRRVELWCPRCTSTDKDIWPPGGIADLIEYEIKGAGIHISQADHTAKHLTSIPVNLHVQQSMSITNLRQQGMFDRPSLETVTRATVTPRDPDA